MTKTSKRIIFFGNEKLATGVPTVEPVILRAVRSLGFEVEKIVTGHLSELGEHQSQLAVLAAYGKIIPKSVLNQFPLGIINVHPSLLPAYRGPTPIEQAMLDGVSKTGVSIMRLSEGMDEGPIYKQKSLPLTGSETKLELTRQLQELGASLLTQILPGIADGSLESRNQPHPDRASYSHKITKQDGVIDWSKPATQLEREVRAFAGWPRSSTSLGGKEVILTKVYIVPSSGASRTPGHIEIVKETGIIMVATGDGNLCIERLQPAGKKEMTAESFINGYLR